MGLGKTLIACVWANAFKKTFDSVKIYIIAPVSLREEWRKTAFQATGMESVPEKLPKHHVDDKNLDIVITTWGKVPKEVPPHVHNFVVICDEAHQMQSMTSARTKDVLNLTSEQRCIGCLLVTGTPMKNGKPLNLFPLLKAVRHPFGDEQKIYEIMFCAGKEKRYGPGKRVWDANGSSNLSILNAHISSHVLYMTKDDCLKNLPPKTRLRHKVAVSRHYEIMYTNRINDLVGTSRVKVLSWTLSFLPSSKLHTSFACQRRKRRKSVKIWIIETWVKQCWAYFRRYDSLRLLPRSMLPLH